MEDADTNVRRWKGGSMTGKDRILTALKGEPTGLLPWAPMMVQDYLTTLPGYPVGPSPETGVDGIFGYLPTCERNPSVAEIRAVWKGRVCLMGGIDTDYLARYSPDAVAEEAARFLEQLRPEDRAILSTSSAAMPGTPPDNFRAVSRVVREMTASWADTNKDLCGEETSQQ